MRRIRAGRGTQAFMMLAVGLVLAAADAGTVQGESHGEQTVSGEVFAEEYDGSGNVAGISIFDDSWGTVMVSPEGKGRELFGHVGAIVEATGEINESEEGDYVLSVSSYRVIEESEPEPEPYDEEE